MAGDISRTNGQKGGRPKANHTLMAEKMRELLIQKVFDEFGPLIDAQIQKAKGTTIVSEKDGTIVFKDNLPDTQAFKTLLEQAVGKPKETIEQTTQIKTLIMDL
ncbi:MAG: hypothetical protein AAB482_00550 [Patescibacteria group bacterium]